jgi:hypothetical protein
MSNNQNDPQGQKAREMPHPSKQAEAAQNKTPEQQREEKERLRKMEEGKHKSNQAK